MATTKNILLPQHITPTHYTIFLAPDLENFIFQGEETIDIKITKPTTKITLHSAEIEVTSVYFENKESIEASKISYDKDAETVTFHFGKSIHPGVGKLKIVFAGILNNKMRGFYRSRYTHKGREYHMGVTQFESTDARRAFPCFDEPSQKATFEVSLKVPSDRTVISNTLEKEIVEHEGGFKVVKFEKSPKMSSYLLAFIIGHFEFIEETTPEKVKVRVYVTPGKKKQAKFALDVASRLMSFYHKYFGIAYPLPTMDLIAIPDFANGAMENWGAVTYRETALLVDEENSSLHTKQWVALIIAHELAHQWFGNLVTMKWWTHLWLNEGFASFMEYLAVDKLFPEWNVWTQFVFTEQARALALDGLFNTHAIEVPVHHPGEISEIFDAVSYSKGASIIRMLQAYVGEKNFQKGLSLYLKTHKYGNAETVDLWKALEKVSNLPVSKIMKNWTSKPGYPLVTMERVGGKVMLSQERFYSSPLEKGSKDDLWLIPFSIITDDWKKPAKILMTKKNITVDGFKDKSWIKGNAGDTSFVRVKYDKKNLLSLESPIMLQDERVGEEGRFALVRDAFALVEAGQIPASEALELLTAYQNEKSYIVWAEIVTHLLELKSLLYGEKVQNSFYIFAIEILAQITSHIGWDKKKGESHETSLLRSTVLYALGTFGDKNTVKKAKTLFSLHLKNKKIHSDIRSLVYALNAENGGMREYKVFEKIYFTDAQEEEKDRALRAMTSFTDPVLLQKALEAAFSPEVRAQDAFKVISLMSSNPIGIDIAWKYIRENWKEVEERFAGGHLFSRFIAPFSKFTTNKKALEIEKFFTKNKAHGIERTVAQTLEKIRSNAVFLEKNKKDIEIFLAKKTE
jgi:puromycin-sensitive aminopeptidase